MAEERVGLALEITTDGMATGEKAAVRSLQEIKKAAGQTIDGLARLDAITKSFAGTAARSASAGTELARALLDQIRELRELTAAWSRGSDAALSYQRRQEAASLALQAGVTAGGQMAQMLERLSEVRRRAEGELVAAANVATIQAENELLRQQIVAYRQGAAAVADFNLKKEVSTALTAAGVTLATEQGRRLAAEIAERQKLVGILETEAQARERAARAAARQGRPAGDESLNIRGIRSSLGRSAAGFLAVDAIARSAQELVRRLAPANEALQDFTGSLVGFFDKLRSFDLVGAAAQLGQAIGTGLAMHLERTEDALAQWTGGMTRADLEIERHKNLANALARQGYDVVGKSIQQLVRIQEDSIARMQAARESLVGDVAGAESRAVDAGRFLAAEDAAGRLKSLTPQMRESIQGLLDELERLGGRADPVLQGFANRFGVTTTSTQKHVDSFRQSLGSFVDGALKDAENQSIALAEAARAVRDEYDPLGARLRKLEEQQRTLTTAGAKFAGTLAQVRVEAELLKNALGENGPLAGGLVEPVDLTRTRQAAEVWRGMSKAMDESAESAGVFLGWQREGADTSARIADALRQASEYVAATETASERWAREARETERLYSSIRTLLSELPEGLRGLYGAELDALLQRIVDRQKQVKFDSWMGSLRTVAEMLGQSNDQLGRMANRVLDVAQAWQEVKRARAAGESTAGGYAQIAQAVYGLGQDAGWWGPKGGTSQFGAKKEGNYAKEGEAVGTIVGGIIGSFFGPAGTMAGAAIGQALGGIIGSFIKKGADEGLAKLRYEAGEIGIRIQKDEGGLGSVLKGIGADIRDSILGITAILGGELQGLADIDLKVRDDVVTVVVNGIKRRFKEVDAAISFAVAEALRTAEITGLSNAMQQLLQGGRFESVEALQSAVEFVRSLEKSASGVSDLAWSMQNMAVQAAAAEQQLRNYGIAADEAANLAWGAFYQNLLAARRGVTGGEMSREEQLKQKQAEIDIWNAQKKLAIAKIDLEMVQVRAQLEAGRIKTQLVQQEVGILEYELKGFSGYIGARAQLSEQERAVLERTLEALGVYRDKLASLADLNIKDVRLNGIGRAANDNEPIKINTGNEWHQRMLAALEGLRDYQKRLVFGEASPFTGRQKVETARAEVDRILAQYQAGGRQRVLAVEQMPQVFDQYLSLFRETFGSSGAYESEARRINDIVSRVLSQNGVSPLSVMQEQARANADEMRRIFARDSRGKLHTRNEELEERIERTNLYAERTSRDVARMAETEERVASAVESLARSSNSVTPPPPQQFRQAG